MEKFGRLEALAAPLDRSNVDTEVIIPITRLIAHKRGTLGPYCFEPWRYRADGTLDAAFSLNSPRYAGAKILVSGANFGCGSSREAAVWALQDMGFRCVIASSFGDIFRANAFQNGLLAIALDPEALQALHAHIASAPTSVVTVDLEARTLAVPGGAGGDPGRSIPFEIDPERRLALLEGLDEIGLTRRSLPDILAFMRQDEHRRPWAYPHEGLPHD
jgi:3-isopropylmalate/(R)-2-methylmalate dehydratase small subunit